ncbi:MAG: hypothetical protein L3K09_01650 [Thermoplasmata archaeon]|nr:hypothetical protein [Thermoplasmata archaeon]
MCAEVCPPKVIEMAGELGGMVA